MKVQNLNNSSVKTRKLIKDTFIQMLSEKKEINKVTVSALTERANISRATFYSHFDDIYGVVEEFEDELINAFFTNMKLLDIDTCDKFFEAIFLFMKENNENYKMLCKSDEALVTAKKLGDLAVNKLFEIFNADPRIKNKDYLELDIRIFFSGMLNEYIKYCRNQSVFTLEELYRYSEYWYHRFVRERCL